MYPHASVPAAVCLAALCLVAPAFPVHAQDVEALGRLHGVRPPPGYFRVRAADPRAYEFRHAWKDVARRVRERRAACIRARDYGSLNAHLRFGPSMSAARSAGTAVAGTLRIPVLAGLFADSTHAFEPTVAGLDSVLFGPIETPPSLSALYTEMSQGLLDVTGAVFGWFTADGASTHYEGTNQGLDPSTDRTGDFIVELLDAADPTVDFSVYDSNGDGRVDVLAILHPLRPGGCGSTHIWSHRFVLSAWTGSPYRTDDGVTVDDYIIQPAVGGGNGCDSTSIMGSGTIAHELGHAFDLPDLYNTSARSFGIGVWGLMGTGGHNSHQSPSHLMAWSKEDLGWITVDVVDSTLAGPHELPPIVENAVAIRIEPSGPTNEYFLLENRQPIGSDVNLKSEGLLIWHIDADRVRARRISNSVNASVPHAVALVQADGDRHLERLVNNGDSGDPYPGATANTELGPGTTPEATLNDGFSARFRIDGITANPDRSIALRAAFNLVPERITTNVPTGTEVLVDGTPQPAPHSVVWEYPGTHTIGVESVQGDESTRHTFQSWSDGGGRVHDVAVDATPDTFVAMLATDHRLRATSDPGGSVASSVALDPETGAWVPQGTSVTLVAEPDPADTLLFAGWTGDTIAVSDTLILPMMRPYTVHAAFGGPVRILVHTIPDGMMGDPLYRAPLDATGGSGAYRWSVVSGALPAELTLDSISGMISGPLTEDGTFEFAVRAASGPLSDERTYSIEVGRPVPAVERVTAQLLGSIGELTFPELRFLDLIGNRNGSFDVGDLRAYLQERGIVADLVARSDGTDR